MQHMPQETPIIIAINTPSCKNKPTVFTRGVVVVVGGGVSAAAGVRSDRPASAFIHTYMHMYVAASAGLVGWEGVSRGGSQERWKE